MDAIDTPLQAAAQTDGFHLLVEALKLNDIDTIYGVVGIPITDLARLAQAEGIRYIGFRHEQPAGHAAAISGYLTRKPGVCLTVSGPGFLNGMVALANATTNCFPMILISGSSDRAIVDLQQGDYEELDQMVAAKPYAKASFRINRPQDIGIGLARAIRAAVSGRPGGVYLDVPAALLASTMDAAAGRASLLRVVDAAPRQLPAPDAIARAAALLAGAARPLLIFGKGAAYAQADAAIRGFVEQSGIPFLPMSMAKGLLPDAHPLSAATARSYALAQADVVMLVGARLNWLLGHGTGHQWAAATQFIQVDIAATEFDSNRAIAAPVCADIGSAMEALLAAPQLQAPAPAVAGRQSWRDAIDGHKLDNAARMAQHLDAQPAVMDYYSSLRAVRDVLAERPEVYVVNEGANALDFGRNILDMQLPRKRLDSGTWGVMGVGLAYAIGAAVVSGQPVVAIEGDSAFGFSGMELETICRYRLPVVVVVLNNGGIYHGNEADVGGAPAPTRLMPQARYEKLIEAFGGAGHYATTPREITAALTAALASGAPALINCVIDPAAGTESGHLKNLNPHSAVGAAAHPDH